MKKLLIILGVIVVLLVAAVIIIPSLIPVDTYKEQIAGQVREQTGRDFAINGDVSLSLFPNVTLEVNDVTFGNAPGGRAAQMATLKRLDIDVKLFPAFSGELDINRLILIDPVINLEVLPDGKANWDLMSASTSASTDTDGSGGPGLAQLRLGDVRLENGRVSYFDAKSGAEQVLSDVNLSLELESIASPFSATGSMVWQDETIDITIDADELAALMEGGSTGVGFKVGSTPVNLDYKGTVTGGGNAGATGDVSLNVPSVRKLMSWVGSPMAEGSGFQLLDIKGKLAASAGRASFSGANIAFDNITGTGELSVDATGSVPAISGRLDLEELDVNPYLPQDNGGEDAASTSAGWSDEPLDFGALRAFNADFTLTAKGIKAQQITIGPSALTLKVAGGKMTGDLTEFQLYEGSGTGRFILDASGSVPAVQKQFGMSGIQAEPLLRDAVGNDRLSGSGNLSFAIDAKGISQREMVQNLNGNGAFDFRDGAIKGINLAAMVRNVSSAFLDSGAGEEQKTDFSELSATFTIINGILSNDDLQMSSPLFRVSGVGTADLPARTVNYTVKPKLVASTTGQGGEQETAGISVPVIITGPWDDLSYAPDLTAALGDPEELAKGAAGAVEGLVEGGTAGAVGELVGGTGESGTGAGVIKGLLEGGGAGDGESAPATEAAGETTGTEGSPDILQDTEETIKGLFGD